MKKAVGYVRVSTSGQVGEDKFGIDAQKEQIEKYASENGYELIRIYVEAGKSGAKTDRPELDKIMYGNVANPPIEAVIVAASDRIARDVQIYYYYEYCLMQKDIELISVKEDFGVAGDLAPLLKSFIVTMAQIERSNINKRTVGGRAVKAAQGGYSGGSAPYGYKAVGHQLAICEEEAEMVRRVFELHYNGYNKSEITRIVNEEGYKSRSGKEVNRSAIFSIISNEKTYRGYYHYGEHGEWVKGKHKPILD